MTVLSKKAVFSVALSLCLFSAAAPAQKKSAGSGGEVRFKKTRITGEFISEGVATGDVNRDGKTDILSGAYWFEAPHWTKHEIDAPQAFDYKKGYSNSFLNYAMDVNQDGWVDFIRIDHPGEAAYWYENPKNKAGHWTRHQICNSLGNENPILTDMDGDGRPDLVGNDSKAG